MGAFGLATVGVVFATLALSVSAFGIMVTLVWLYIEELRLLSLLRQ